MIPKFRVYETDRKVMHYTDKDLVVCFSDNGVDVIDHTTFSSSCMDIDNFVLMQSTGLKDKHGVEIFEGDIIDKGYLNFSIENRIGYVEFNQGGDSDGWAHGDWLGWITNNNDSLLDVHEHCTVIGNKYEHTHLLEEE